MKSIFFTFLLISGFFASAQHFPEGSVTPENNKKNINVKNLYGDSLQSGFLIWVRNEVKAHRHNAHSEVVVVLKGRAMMTLNGKRFKIRKGDIVCIPKGAIHSVKTLSKKPLQVLSVQSPYFDGSDREWVTETK
jgi:mannose-6-phosphate isomerase-like protein (cupin superfamily)